MKGQPDPATQQILAQWVEREAAVRERINGTDIIPPEQLAQRPGIELMQGIMDGTLPVPPIAHSLGFLLVEVSQGRAVFQGLKHPVPALAEAVLDIEVGGLAEQALAFRDQARPIQFHED